MTVPVTLPLIVDESGEVHTGTAEIINGSTGEVVVSSVSISTKKRLADRALHDRYGTRKG